MYGEYTITKRKAEFIDGEWIAGDIVDVFGPFKNVITPQMDRMIRSRDEAGRNDSEVVIIVSEGIFRGALTMSGNDAYSVKGTVAEVTVYTESTGMDDGFWEVTTTINPPSSETRNIRTIGLSTLSGAALVDCYSLVSLSGSCPQTTEEILQVNYRLVLDSALIASEGSVAVGPSEVVFGNYAIIFTNTPGFIPVTAYLLSWDRQIWGTGIRRNASGPAISTSTTLEIHKILAEELRDNDDGILVQQGLIQDSYLAQLGNSNNPTSNTNVTGFPIKGVGIGQNSQLYTIADVDKGTDSALQNTFGRAADTGAADRPPFLNVSVIATSPASINWLDKGDWVDHINDSYMVPYLYRINIDLGGLVGAAEYKIRRRKLLRIDNNDVRWKPLGIVIPTTATGHNGNISFHQDPTTREEERHGQRYWGNTSETVVQILITANRTDTGFAGWTVQRYVYPEFLTWDYTGFTITDTEANWVNVDSNSPNAFTVTEALQCATDGSNIYIADAGTGLWKIERSIGDFDTNNFTYTRLQPPGITDDTSCRGVFSKGGSVWGSPGVITEIQIERAGSNYSVTDTINIFGANGTGATAEVGSVNGDGGITSVFVTAPGSAYIEDNIQALVDSASAGVGAKLEPMIGSGGNIWALFDDVADGVMYLTHITRIVDDSTNLNFNTTGDTITGSGGTNFHTAGFVVGMKLIIKNAEDAGNNGTFTISAMNTNGLEITVSENLVTNATDTTAQMEGVKWEVMRSTITTTETLTYVANGAGVGDTITGSGTSFITQGFVEGLEIVISASASNDGTYTIANVTATVITLIPSDVLVSEGPNSDTMATLTDFTITNYTSGSPGRTGFIGLLLDTEHADDRFMMLTPTNKNINNGTAISGSAGFNWWSFANSTGTTTAGATDEARVNETTQTNALKGEQIATLIAGPLSLGNQWLVAGYDYDDSGSIPFGSSTVTSRTFGLNMRYTPLKNKTTFNNTVIGRGNINGNELSTRDDVADMGTASSFDTVLIYDFGSFLSSDYSPSNFGGASGGTHFGHLGKGVMWSPKQADAPATVQSVPATLNPGGLFMWTPNGTGLITDEDNMPWGFWEEYGWTGNEWQLGHVAIVDDATSIDFNGAGNPDTITQSGGTDFDTLGFAAGQQITIANSEGAGENDGKFTIGSVSGAVITLISADTLVTNNDDTTATITHTAARETHLEVTWGGTSLDINATTGALVGSGTWPNVDWAGDGFEVGDIITLSSAEDPENDGSYVIEQLSGTTATVTPNKLPTTTNAADTTIVIIGSHAVIDGLALSFDDNAAANAFVLNEYYDTHLFDGILKDNSTTAEWKSTFAYNADEIGTDFSAATVPANEGQVSGEKLYAHAVPLGTASSMRGYVEPGLGCFINAADDSIIFEPRLEASTDFEVRWKMAGCEGDDHIAICGIAPYATAIDGTTLLSSEVDQSIRVEYDLLTNPTLDLYDITVRDVGNGSVIFTENADRIVLIDAQDETFFDNSPTSEGTFIGGNGVGGGGAHVVNDILTMNDGSTITVDAIDGNDDVTEFTITTDSTKTTGRTQASVGSNDYTDLDLNSGTNDITINGGTAFDTDGFRVGMKLVIYSATESANNGIYTITGVSSTIITLAESITTTNAADSAVQINTAIVQDSSDGSGTDFVLILGVDNEASAAIGGDEYSLHRIGTGSGNLSWRLNGVEFFTHAGALNSEWAFVYNAFNDFAATMYEAEIDYTINRRYLSVGNGTTTGANDTNFRALPVDLAGTTAFQLFFDSGSGPVEFTYQTDGKTAPGANEVTILPWSGRLWFNDANDGDTITGNWTTTKQINLT